MEPEVAGQDAAYGFRSEHTAISKAGYNAVPRIVWMLWFDGWKNAPALCLDMLKTWRAYNADWQIRTICSWKLHGKRCCYFSWFHQPIVSNFCKLTVFKLLV